MKATWTGEGTYRLGDEHGDLVDDYIHPIERYADVPVKPRTLDKREERRRNRKK